MLRHILVATFFHFYCQGLTFAQTTKPEFIEMFTMTLVYQLGFVNIPSGEIQFQVSKNNLYNRPGLNLEAKGNTLKTFDFLYTYSSCLYATIDPKTSQLAYSERNVFHNGKTFKENYVFDHNKNIVYCKTLNEKSITTFDTLQLKGKIYEFLTAFRHLRFLNYNEMKPGQKIAITILLENNLYPLQIKFSGTEKILLPDGAKHTCYKINVQTIEGSVFKGEDALSAWISVDNRRLPVQINADILVGSLKAYLISPNYPNLNLSSNQ